MGFQNYAKSLEGMMNLQTYPRLGVLLPGDTHLWDPTYIDSSFNLSLGSLRDVESMKRLYAKDKRSL